MTPNSYQALPSSVTSSSYVEDLSLAIAGRVMNPGAFWNPQGMVDGDSLAIRLANFEDNQPGYLSGGMWTNVVSILNNDDFIY